ncbi:cobalamin biosynthesis protein CobQ [Phaeovulum sp.]|uniref:cobalamin biosynthesis protein CobQ n=1 Tax=Phaeovulum sp. TaxID=2934796 RepID=UPI00273134E0|nr:cobalamin biosynthesis protein CobQ [Phaeovulum sp.]MDP1668112.1 cobalamin biosynthesis protein CobQ [Phaeovulum sp.]MDZ4120387.1 cobalamin biosynthesis protein CobQ [Phaeovulum sp.]
MNTPTHMLIGAALFARRGAPRVTLAAFAGGLVPDLAMFALIFWATRVAGMSQGEVFGSLFFSDDWQRIFAVDHSFFVWGTLFAVAARWRFAVLRAFAGGGLAHAAADFLTHRDDARQQLWPVSDWVFRSPVSYWDQAYYGNIVAPLELALVLVLTGVLLLRLTRAWERAMTLLVATILIVPVILSGGFHGLHGLG